MGKTNFTKAEEALIEALQKLTVQQLLELADASSNTENDLFKRTKARTLLLTALKYELKKLHRNNAEIYKTVEISKSNLEKWLENPASLSDEEWKAIAQAKTKVDEELKKLQESAPSNDQLVEDQRRKHINKRFNVSDKWLPLQ